MDHNPNLEGFKKINDRFYFNKSKRLGGGNYGQVYLGYDNVLKKFIAVKNIPKANLTNFGTENKQIQIMKKLKHPNIMQFYDSFGSRFQPEGIFMFLQLCEKGTLKEMIVNKITQLQAFELFKQLVEGMTYVNEQKIFHRDLKPENLLITQSNELKIADFGIARQIQNSPKATFKKCTPIYSAPQVYMEQIYENNKEAYDEKCDVFSAGYILYEMLTGEELNKGVKTAKDLKQFFNKNKAKGYFTIQHPALNQEWINLLKKMLLFDPTKRPSFKQIRQSLNYMVKPQNKHPQARPPSYSEEQKSKQYVSNIKKLVQTLCNRNNYLINVLKIFNQFQGQKTSLVPRVYKLLLLYFSLCRYCYLTKDGISSLDNKQEFILPDVNKNLVEIESYMTNEDKAEIYNYFRTTSSRINKGKQQIKLLLLSQIIPTLQKFAGGQAGHPERQVFSQYHISEELKSFKESEQYEGDISYVSNFNKATDNLYRTTDEVEALNDFDLKIYLTLLYVARIDKFVNIAHYSKATMPPTLDQIKKMNRQELVDKIEKIKREN